MTPERKYLRDMSPCPACGEETSIGPCGDLFGKKIFECQDPNCGKHFWKDKRELTEAEYDLWQRENERKHQESSTQHQRR